MKSSLKLFFSLFLAAGSFTAFAASYTDGIEYFKAGQPDRAKILLERTLDDAFGRDSVCQQGLYGCRRVL